MSKFAIGEKVDNAADDHEVGTVIAIFPTVEGDVRYAVDMEGYGARFTSDRVAISFYIATSDADVKLPRAAHPVVQRTISASAFDVRHSASDCQGTGVLVSWLKRRMLE